MIAEEEASWRRTLADQGSGSLPAMGPPMPQLPTSAATEPETTCRSRACRCVNRWPSAAIGALILVLVMGIVFLIRDLEEQHVATARRRASGRDRARRRKVASCGRRALHRRRAWPPTPSPTRAAAPAAIVTEIPHPADDDIEADEPRERDDRSAAQEAFDRRANNRRDEPDRRATKSSASTVAPVATRAHTSASRSADEADCFEHRLQHALLLRGRKKIFKPGCL